MDWIFKLLGGIVENPIAGSVKWIAGGLKDVLINIFKGAIIPLLNNVMAYQNFFSEGVNAGWDIARNFSNLFFALILLLIAISTVLGIGALDNYTAKRMLPQFIFVALFINFSKAIVGFLIDISQIIMISFYNSFGPNMADIIGNAAKIAEAAAESNTEDLTINIFTIVIVAFLAFVLLWTALILAMRIVTLWFVIMLAPLAFMSSLIPGLKGINSEWTKNLQEALITGPTLMFLLYLAFAVMSQGISANTTTTGGDNLVNNGNLINYVLVVGLLFIANTKATQAAQAAPSILKNAVGVAGTIATLGLGAYVGAGGYNTNQLRKKTIELGDKGIGGATRGLQIASGGKIKANSRYEAMKKDMVARNDAGKGLFGGFGQQFSKAGQEEQQKDFELQQAREYNKSGKIDDPDKKRYKKILTASMAEVASEIKDATNAAELGKMYLKALKDGEVEAAAQIAAKISTLNNGWDIAMTDRENRENPIFKEALKKGSRSEQMKHIWEQSFGNIVPNNGVMREAQSRVINNLKDKGQGGFADGLANVNSSEKAVEGGVAGVARAFSKNTGILDRRKSMPDLDPTTGEKVYANKDDGTPIYETDPKLLHDMIINEGEKTLRDPKSWAPFDKKRKDFDQVLRDILAGKYKADIPTPDTAKIEAALEGIDQGYSKPKRPAGFRTD